jgi:heme-degrading monooxygenase HmoA|tara:strand:+ start:812 stop:1132 length:321 start_codon:yes stop_codon:yes gene_type:complete
MFIAMNRFSVDPEQGHVFESVWRERESYLADLDGFVQFALLKGDDPGVYISHTTWEARDDFDAWTQSEHFKNAHRQAGPATGVILGHPEVSYYEAILVESAEGVVS